MKTHKDSFSVKLDPFPDPTFSAPYLFHLPPLHPHPTPHTLPGFDGFQSARAGNCACDSNGGKSVLPSVIKPAVPHQPCPGCQEAVLLMTFLLEPSLPSLCREVPGRDTVTYIPK